MGEKVFSFRLPLEQFEAVASRAKQEKTSINNILKGWVDDGLADTPKYVVEDAKLRSRIRSKAISSNIDPRDLLESELRRAFEEKPVYEFLADDVKSLEETREGKLCRLESGNTGADTKRIINLFRSIGEQIIRVMFFANKNFNNEGVLIALIEAPKVKFLLDDSLINIARMPRLFEVQDVFKTLFVHNLHHKTYYCPHQIRYQRSDSVSESIFSLESETIKPLGPAREALAEFLHALYPPFSTKDFLSDDTEWKLDNFYPAENASKDKLSGE